MNEPSENLYKEEYFEYLHQRNSFRKFIRKFYLRDIKSYCIKKTIDFGCGVGELLSTLPEGSIGFEVNPVAVEYCRSNGLRVEYYDPGEDNYQFNMLEKGNYSTFTMNHVLEHIEDVHIVIARIFESCYRLGINRIVFTIPGQKGFKSDATHRTFIDLNYLSEQNLLNNKYYQLMRSKYFPVNWKKFSQFFTHNELRLIFDIKK